MGREEYTSSILGVYTMIEEWKDYDGVISVSNLGNVRNNKTGYLYSKHDNGHGYLSVNITLKIDGMTYVCREYIHRLVLKTFKPCSNDELQVNHIDFNRANNTLDNLEWVTIKQNMAHNVKHGRVNTKEANDVTRQPIIVYDKYRKKYDYFDDIKTGSRHYGFNEYRFSHILNRHKGITKRFIVSRVKEKMVCKDN